MVIVKHGEMERRNEPLTFKNQFVINTASSVLTSAARYPAPNPANVNSLLASPTPGIQAGGRAPGVNNPIPGTWQPSLLTTPDAQRLLFVRSPPTPAGRNLTSLGVRVCLAMNEQAKVNRTIVQAVVSVWAFIQSDGEQVSGINKFIVNSAQPVYGNMAKVLFHRTMMVESYPGQNESEYIDLVAEMMETIHFGQYVTVCIQVNQAAFSPPIIYQSTGRAAPTQQTYLMGTVSFDMTTY
jgi:hypothetical protein